MGEGAAAWFIRQGGREEIVNNEQVTMNSLFAITYYLFTVSCYLLPVHW